MEEQASVVMGRSIKTSTSTFLTMPDAGNYARAVCGFSKVPEEYQMEMKTQIIACIAP